MPDTPPKIISTVSDITRHIKQILETNAGLHDVWMKGEVSNLTRHSSGHWYFSLKDAGAQIRAVMFKRYADDVPARIEEGMEVVTLGSVSVYEKRGEYQFYVRYMEPAGIGALYLQFEQLKKKLDAEGLFEQHCKRSIPRFPRRIAVITSPTGAAVRDVINVITRRFPAVEVLLIPTVVQGEEAPSSICAAFDTAAMIKPLDTVLLVRGGGSIEDLWGFNSEDVARRIVACAAPVISGVGHETDFTIADFVSDLRAPTPSAAAEIAVPDLRELKRGLDRSRDLLEKRALDMVKYYDSRLDTIAARLSPERMIDRLDRFRQYFDDMQQRSTRALAYRLAKSKDRVESIALHLDAISPDAVLQRGYSFCRDQRTGKVIKSVATVKNGQALSITMHDGSFAAKADLRNPENQTVLDFE